MKYPYTLETLTSAFRFSTPQHYPDIIKQIGGIIDAPLIYMQAISTPTLDAPHPELVKVEFTSNDVQQLLPEESIKALCTYPEKQRDEFYRYLLQFSSIMKNREHLEWVKKILGLPRPSVSALKPVTFWPAGSLKAKAVPSFAQLGQSTIDKLIYMPIAQILAILRASPVDGTTEELEKLFPDDSISSIRFHTLSGKLVLLIEILNNFTLHRKEGVGKWLSDIFMVPADDIESLNKMFYEKFEGTGIWPTPEKGTYQESPYTLQQLMNFLIAFEMRSLDLPTSIFQVLAILKATATINAPYSPASFEVLLPPESIIEIKSFNPQEKWQYLLTLLPLSSSDANINQIKWISYLFNVSEDNLKWINTHLFTPKGDLKNIRVQEPMVSFDSTIPNPEEMPSDRSVHQLTP